MKIKWDKIIAIILIIVVLVFWTQNQPDISNASNMIKHMNDPDPKNRIFGMAAFVILMTTLVAIVKLLTHRK